jgi:hypothetical protein
MPLRGLIGLRHPQAPAGLARDRQSVRQQRSDRAASPRSSRTFALFHAGMADRAGNVFVGRDRELATMAHCLGAHHRDGGERFTTAI